MVKKFAGSLFMFIERKHNLLGEYSYIHYSSSTARGGGGSFEKRKTIGEIGCCESRMSEQKH